jgi:hypothetical protein
MTVVVAVPAMTMMLGMGRDDRTGEHNDGKKGE